MPTAEAVQSGTVSGKPVTGDGGKITAMARYRAAHRRFDYVPSPEALQAINRHREMDTAFAGVIDHLIMAGDRAISGNGVAAAVSELTEGLQ